MIDVFINSVRRRCPVRWAEVTLGQMQALSVLAAETPPAVLRRFERRAARLAELHRRKTRGACAGRRAEGAEKAEGAEGIERVERAEGAGAVRRGRGPGEAYGRFCAGVLSVMSGFPAADCLRAGRAAVIGFAERYLSPFVGALGCDPAAGSPGTPDFPWRGERLELPRPGRDAAGEPMPCAELPAGVFCDATALYATHRIACAGLIVALLCRPAGEPFDLRRALERAGTMAGLSMAVVWAVFARLTGAHRYLRREYPGFYASARVAGAGAAREGPAWDELPLLAAECRPSELEAVRRMSGYELVRLLAVRSQLRKKALL